MYCLCRQYVRSHRPSEIDVYRLALAVTGCRRVGHQTATDSVNLSPPKMSIQSQTGAIYGLIRDGKLPEAISRLQGALQVSCERLQRRLQGAECA